MQNPTDRLPCSRLRICAVQDVGGLSLSYAPVKLNVAQSRMDLQVESVRVSIRYRVELECRGRVRGGGLFIERGPSLTNDETEPVAKRVISTLTTGVISMVLSLTNNDFRLK